MCSQNDLESIVLKIRSDLERLFPDQRLEVILFGSYARDDADEGSDIDLLFLVDASREEIAGKNWRIGEAAADALMDYGIVVSPIVENREYFRSNSRTLPFFRNIEREGVRVNA